MTERRQPRARWGALAALAVGLLVLLTPLNEHWSRPLLDAQLRLLAPDKPPTGVLVLDIDDASLAALQPQFGPWPYKRDVYALAIENLRALGARAVALDLLLVDAQPGDTALARTLARPGAPVVLAAAGLRHFSGPAAPLPQAARPPSLPVPAHRWPTIALPTASVWPEPQQPPAVGVITTPMDADGVLRRLPLWHEAEGRRWPVLPHALHQLLAPQAASAPLPLDASGALHFAFAPASAASPALPLSRLFLRETGASLDGAAADDEALRQRVQGHVVFIGSSALLGDAVMTVQGQASGTQVLAQAYAALRDGHWTRPPLAWADATLLGLALLPALASVRRRRPQPRRDIVAHAAALLAVAALAAWWLLQMRLPTLWAAPLAALAAGLGTALLLHARQQVAAQQRLAQELAVTAEAARAKGQFLANVSHEIRTPLNAVLGVAELLAESELTDTQRRQVQLFQEAGQTLHALINDLLDLSKIEANRLELEIAPFALHALLQRLVALLQAQAQRKGLALRLELAPGLPAAVSGDSLRLERALTNLVSNAVKFTARGEVLLRARPDPSLPDGLCFEIIDTGIGIAPSKLESIFEPFSQADGSVTRLYGGTGLGLALTRSVTRLLGGTVDVQSTPGQGSVFTLRLPLPAAELPAVAEVTAVAAAVAADARPGAGAPAGGTPATQAGAAAAAGRPARLRLLLAEDNEVNSYLFTAMLADEDLDIDLAPNGLAAWEMLRRQPYDIAFIDVQMPGLDGLSLTRQWRAHEREARLATMPMVSLTANAFASDVQASREAGSSLHLAKPYSKQQLLDVLHSLAPQARAAPPSPAHALAGAEPGYDLVLSRQRLGADPAAFQRVAEHAKVFLEAWPTDFSRAQAEGETGHAQGLADDLLDVAMRLGAQGLTAQAVRLRDALAGGDAEAVRAARLRVQQALAPVLLALFQAA